ncbi:hypothetical protein DJ013_01130 [Arcticibacterium luteifluviistationis]|uniref:DUF4403 domain-containing protein n=2 Tax=Arcticibacterium luteifluviistationis TaxID=1784714 RepID=A0A2Z4G6T4_9BACT|nr:hypothetical protein DJ013_01130 [Arcticibacterium luteifluviistationis]
MNKWNGLKRHKKRNLDMGPRWFTLSHSLLFVGLLLLTACSKKYNAEAPSESYSSVALDSLSNKVSYLTVPLNIDLREVEKQVNQNFKGLIYDDDSFSEDDLKYKIWKNDDLKFKHRGQGVFEFKVPLKIWVEKRVKILGMTQTPSTEFEIIANFTSKPFIAADWKLKSVTNAEGFEWVTQPKLTLGGFTVPITSIVGGIINNYQGTIARMIDTKISEEIDLVSPVLKVWNDIKAPVNLSSDYNLWLQVIPQDVLMTALNFDNNSINTSVAIKAIVNSSVGKVNKPVNVSTELPPIKFANTLPEGFGIHLYNLVTFNEAEKIAKGMFVGKKMTISSGKEIEITGLRIYGGKDNKVIIQVNTIGDMKGTIFLTGDPVYDKNKREIILKNIDFDIKTKSLLIKTASWFMSGTFARQIEDSFGIPVDPIFDGAKSSINDLLNSQFKSGLSLKGKLKDISPGAVYLKSEGLMTTVIATGNLEVKLTSFAPKK